jgi:hypothetical protein
MVVIQGLKVREKKQTVTDSAQEYLSSPGSLVSYVRESEKKGNVCMKRNSSNNWYRRKLVSITYSECMSVALIIQHAMCMNRIILPPVACPTLPHSPTLSHKIQDIFWGGVEGGRILNMNVCFDFIYNFCLKHFSF